MIDRNLFFSAFVTAFEKQLSKTAQESVTAIFDAFEAQGLTDRCWLAYILATAYHETQGTFVGGKKVKNTAKSASFQRVRATFARRGYAAALVEGMVQGHFNGNKLADFFNDRMIDWRQARRIIHGRNHAEEIMHHAIRFFVCLRIEQPYPFAQAG